MSVYGGPDIITDGLVLCLDAGNTDPNSNGYEINIAANSNPTISTNCNIGVIRIYNIGLSASRVFKNHNAQEERFQL